MSEARQALAQRIRELRRRHFGPRGKEAFAQKLNVPLDEYVRYERGVVPPGELMVRMCELTGEDLQWLLTGVPARGTVVISGTRRRHQDLLTRLAQLLDSRPELAAPVEAFMDLLAAGRGVRAEKPSALPGPSAEDLIPIFEPDELPSPLPDCKRSGGHRLALAGLEPEGQPVQRQHAELTEPAMSYPPDTARRVEVLTFVQPGGRVRRCLRSRELARWFPNAFGVRLADDSMRPMFAAGEILLVAADAEPRVGWPALCRLVDEPRPRCRIWLGEEGGLVRLGRLADGQAEEIPPDRVIWSLNVLFRMALAA